MAKTQNVAVLIAKRRQLQNEIKATFKRSDDPSPKMRRATLSSQLKALGVRITKAKRNEVNGKTKVR